MLFHKDIGYNVSIIAPSPISFITISLQLDNDVDP